MRRLLTSAGIKNPGIHNALLDLLGKPIAGSRPLCIPTATHALPGGAGHAWRFISGQEPRTPMCELAWKSLGVLELTALPSLKEELWVPMVRETDVLLVKGGDPLYVCYWIRQSGPVDFSLFPHLDHADLPENTMADAEKWVAGMSVPAYAIDDETAITAVDGSVEVISEVHWKLFAPWHQAAHRVCSQCLALAAETG